MRIERVRPLMAAPQYLTGVLIFCALAKLAEFYDRVGEGRARELLEPAVS
jgi:hypothetical protein